MGLDEIGNPGVSSGNGGVIGASNSSEVGGTPGIWSINDAYKAAVENKWPTQNHAITAPGSSTTTITADGKTYKVHTFTSPGSLVVSGLGFGVPNTLEYLVVAGGGSGSYTSVPGQYGPIVTVGGGGGAGGMLTGNVTLTTGTFPVVVGAANNPSTLSASPSPVSATRGGPGGTPPGGGGTPGGSGGGGARTPGPTVGGGSGISGQGNPGGSGDSPSGGGGGGAGGSGSPYASNNGAGGAGLTSNINGTTTTYAVGGPSPAAGNPAYGSGGGGGGAGIPGIIIVRYEVIS